MRKTLAILLAATTLISATSANAQWRDRRHEGPRPGYNGGGNWVAPLVGGLIIGGIVGSLAEQNQLQQQQVVQPQVFCRMEPAYDQYGNFVGRIRRCYTQ